jgi:Co/Zn/Cd efflux system component
MHTHSIDDFRHSHVFLGEAHERNERKTWAVIAICTAMMVVEIIGGLWFGSVALIADGLHMSTHAGALLIAALAYTYSRHYVNDVRLTFGTGKFGDLAAFTSAIALTMIALLIGYESIDRLISPVPIAFNQAIPIAVVGLGVNLLSAFLLRDDDHHLHDHHTHPHNYAREDHDPHGNIHVHRDNNLRAACDGGCRSVDTSYHWLGLRPAIWLGLDGPGYGPCGYSRYSELVLDTNPLCGCCSSRRLPRSGIVTENSCAP